MMKALLVAVAVLALAVAVLSFLFRRARARAEKAEAENGRLREAVSAYCVYMKEKGGIHAWKETKEKAARTDPAAVVAGILSYNNRLSDASGRKGAASAPPAEDSAGNPGD